MAQATAAGRDATSGGTSLRVKVQRFGSFLSGMVMPNIGAFIAWGLITAMFIPDGWIPNERLAALVEPMILYLLPLLIGYTGGRIVYDTRGGVVGAIATMGVIVGSDIPMLLGALIMGPLGGFLIKRLDLRILVTVGRSSARGGEGDAGRFRKAARASDGAVLARG